MELAGEIGGGRLSLETGVTGGELMDKERVARRRISPNDEPSLIEELTDIGELIKLSVMSAKGSNVKSCM